MKQLKKLMRRRYENLIINKALILTSIDAKIIKNFFMQTLYYVETFIEQSLFNWLIIVYCLLSSFIKMSCKDLIKLYNHVLLSKHKESMQHDKISESKVAYIIQSSDLIL